MATKARAAPAGTAAKSESVKKLKRRVKTAARSRASFVESMECLGVAVLPVGRSVSYEVKFDGWRAQVVKSAGATVLYSRRGNVLNDKFPAIVNALIAIPDETVIDGELVALDSQGRSDFNLLQNFRAAQSRLHYYAFDILMLKGRSVVGLPLSERRGLLETVLPRNSQVSQSAVVPNLPDILRFVQLHGLEGVVAKDCGSIYEAGRRSGWSKHRINQGQEFVVGGYTSGSNGFDALIVGFYKGKELHFAARVRAGFIPATRREVFAQIRHLKTERCPFANLPDTSAGRFGLGLTAEKMLECIWIEPTPVVRLDFLEFTGVGRLRHPTYVAMRKDKDPRKVVRESG